MAKRGKPKRGVLLLVVLSILVIFVLAGLTFIVVASQYQRGSIQQAKHQLTGEEPRNLADRGMRQLLRGPENTSSSLFAHDLLNDLYGKDGFTGLVNGILPDSTGGQVVGIAFAAETPVSRPAGYYSGCVITMVRGPASGLSSRIIRSMDIGASGAVFAEAFLSDQNVVITPQQGDRFVVNGRPNNGAGFGYNPSTGKLDQVESNGLRVALLPNFKAYATTAPVDTGGADESYDAVDTQNMFLAKLPPGATTGREITPSFHRPHLVTYWLQQLSSQFGGSMPPQVLQQVLRQIVLRPNTLDHPLFTGSNPLFSIDADGDMIPDGLVPSAAGPGPGPWDVDNDGDGIPDSIWIDLGLPLATAADGRIYRPLFAFLCTDLDGRLNLNVHGNHAQLDSTYTSLVPTRGVVPGATSDIIAPRGSGYGPPEINLSAVFNVVEQRVLMGERYLGQPVAGTRDILPGFAQFDDDLSAMKSVGVPQDFTDATRPSAYGTPPDLYGRGVTVLDHGGHPVTAFMGQPNETVDDPYELNVVETSPSDAPYTAAELERLLRIFDLDAGLLPDRIRNMVLNSLEQDPMRSISRLVTTHSFDVPVPNVQLPPGLRGGANASSHVIEWMSRRLLRNGVSLQDVPVQLSLMLPFEILHGQKMDVNRLWGNGQDDNANGFVDEDIEVQAQSNMPAANEQMWATNPTLVSKRLGTNVDYTNDYPNVPDQTMARQLFARHLYCMMMMFLEPGYTDPTIRRLPQGSQLTQELTAQRIAQWAINVADFRDNDAIMSPFEYDTDPMNGWQPNIDGDARSNEGGERRIVWGAEYPHLLLTETLAFHDLRLKDSKFDDGEGSRRDENGDGMSNPGPPDQEDDDLDQFRIPQGSFFAELYCTFNPNSTQAPRELYTFDPADRRWKLDLARMSPPTASGAQYPVWRLAISDSQTDGRSQSVLQRSNTDLDLISFQPEKMTSIGLNDIGPPGDQARIDRIVWFTPFRPQGATINSDKIFWNRMGMPTLLPAKHYAVVGSRRLTMIGSQTDQGLSNQIISLLPVRVTRNVAGPGYPRAGVDIQPPIGIIAAMDPPSDTHPTARWTDWPNTAPEGIGVNVSEPLPTANDYYPEPTQRISDPVRYPVQDAYGIEGMPGRKMLDQPLDRPDGVSTRPIERLGGIAEGTIRDYRTVFLQRLANPLLPANPKFGHPAHDPNTPVNPYITVDWLPVDLTIFNGEDRKPLAWSKDEPWTWPEEQPVPGKGANDDGIDFATRERGILAPGQTNGLNVNHWSAVSTPPVNTVPDQNLMDANFQHNIEHTIGFLNNTYGLFQSGRGPAYAGDPQRPFPWLTWNDRPYASHLELMLVPSSSPSRLLFEYSFDQRTNPYDATGRNPAQFRSPYQHLLNFFHSSNNPIESANYHQIFELVEVPSRFVGTERWYNPSMFVRGTATTTPPNDPRGGFRPPFNKLSRFRDPGRVNINTIFDPRVWSAISRGFPAFDSVPFWNLVDQSRRGTSGPFDPNFPTEFANPFRSAAGADLQFELMGMTNVPSVEATLLRSHPAGQPGQPLFGHDSPQLHGETDRNPFFRYQGLQRLGNLVTTHSNVFAVWVTVGYFEVLPWPNPNLPPQPQNDGDSLHQIGYQLGQELNSAGGDVKRHRSFYIIDRSIPVAYEPGKNHNVERAVVLRRFIE